MLHVIVVAPESEAREAATRGEKVASGSIEPLESSRQLLLQCVDVRRPDGKRLLYETERLLKNVESFRVKVR